MRDETLQGTGFSYTLDDDQILRWMSIPIEDRLIWLDKANRFLKAAHSQETREIWEKFRRGEI